MRRRLRLLLDGEDGIEVVAEARDVASVIRHVHDHRPGVLVIDLGMPDGASLDAVRRLREDLPSTEIVVLSMEQSRVFAREALGAGAIGFVLKQAADEELPQAVRRAARGEEYLSPRFVAQAHVAPPRRASRPVP